MEAKRRPSVACTAQCPPPAPPTLRPPSTLCPPTDPLPAPLSARLPCPQDWVVIADSDEFQDYGAKMIP